MRSPSNILINEFVFLNHTVATVLAFDATRRPTRRRASPFAQGVAQHPFNERVAFLEERYHAFGQELRELIDIEEPFIEGDIYLTRLVNQTRDAVREFIVEQHVVTDFGLPTAIDEALQRYQRRSPWEASTLYTIAQELPNLPTHEQIFAHVFHRVPWQYARAAVETNGGSELERGCILAFYQTEPSLKLSKRSWRKSWR